MTFINFELIAKSFANKPVAKIFPHYVDLIANGCCVGCKKVITPFRDAISRKEYGISGLCQDCQDGVFDQ